MIVETRVLIVLINFPFAPVICTFGYPKSVQGVADTFLNPIPETPRAPMAADSDPRTIAS